MNTLRWSYILSAGALLCYPADLIVKGLSYSSGRPFPSDWVLPILALITFFLIPVAWLIYALNWKRGIRKPILPQVGLIPFFLHSALVALFVIGWMATGGL